MTPFEYLESHARERMEQFSTLLAFPTVSAQSQHKADILRCAEWLTAHFKSFGMSAELMSTKGYPVVYAEYIADPKAPTVLYYGHYDVQPPEPFNLWVTKPFEANIRDGYVYARGATDDKGQTFCHIKGLEAIMKSEGKLPLNVKFIIEGEEEVGSGSLPDYLKQNKAKLKADIAVISDTAQFSKTLPAITYGLRGLYGGELFVYGPNRDVHSGAFGGAIPNPATILMQMIAQVHDKKGKITIPGFYRDVKPVSKYDRAQFKKLPFKEAAYKQSIGIKALHGEPGYTVYERTWVRPTFEINGITSGYQGEGSKTIIPSMASCKITCRLVPNQKPDHIGKCIETFFKKIAPKSVTIKFAERAGSAAVEVPTDGPWLDAAGEAVRKGFGKKPVFMKEGGSIPVVGDFKRILGIDTLLIGFGQQDDNIHSPNERFRVVDFENGCRAAAALPGELAKVRK